MYLDRNHWIGLAQLLYKPAKLRTSEVEPARRVTEMARAQQIILPLSGAHLVEAARSDGRRRRDLAHTMLELSRGWQMRSPLRIRDDEIQAAFDAVAAHPMPHLPAEPAFTLAPHALWGTPNGMDTADMPAMDVGGAPNDLGDVAGRMYAVLAADGIENSPEAQQVALAWATSNHKVALFAAAHPKQRKNLRAVSMIRAIRDLRDELARNAAICGMTPVEFESWMADGAERSFAQMPTRAEYVRSPICDLPMRRIAGSRTISTTCTSSAARPGTPTSAWERTSSPTTSRGSPGSAVTARESRRACNKRSR